MLGEMHPDTVLLKKNYADLLAATGRTKEAGQIDENATGLITGSWKAIELDPALLLEESSGES
jgi:hypothetical protein